MTPGLHFAPELRVHHKEHRPVREDGRDNGRDADERDRAVRDQHRNDRGRGGADTRPEGRGHRDGKGRNLGLFHARVRTRRSRLARPFRSLAAAARSISSPAISPARSAALTGSEPDRTTRSRSRRRGYFLASRRTPGAPRGVLRFANGASTLRLTLLAITSPPTSRIKPRRTGARS